MRMKRLLLAALIAFTVGCSRSSQPPPQDADASTVAPHASSAPPGKYAQWLKTTLGNPETKEAGLVDKDETGDRYVYRLKHEGCALKVIYDPWKFSSYKVEAEWNDACRVTDFTSPTRDASERIRYPFPDVYDVKWKRVVGGPLQGHIVAIDYHSKKPTAWRLMSEAWLCRESLGSAQITDRVRLVMSAAPCGDYKKNDPAQP